MSTQNDAEKFLEMIEHCFVSLPIIRKLPRNYFKKILHNDLEEIPHQQSNSLNNNNNEPRKELITENFEVDNKFKLKGSLNGILLYPIKSCGAFSVKQWPITAKGFQYDREWMIVNSQGTAFTQKHNKKLCLVRPYINLKNQVMELKFTGKFEKMKSNQLNLRTMGVATLGQGEALAPPWPGPHPSW